MQFFVFPRQSCHSRIKFAYVVRILDESKHPLCVKQEIQTPASLHTPCDLLHVFFVNGRNQFRFHFFESSTFAIRRGVSLRARLKHVLTFLPDAHGTQGKALEHGAAANGTRLQEPFRYLGALGRP